MKPSSTFTRISIVASLVCAAIPAAAFTIHEVDPALGPEPRSIAPTARPDVERGTAQPSEARPVAAMTAADLERASGPRPTGGRPNRILFGLGLPHLQVREEILRPFRWDGFGGLLALGYERRSPSMRHAVGLEVPAAWVTNRYGAGGAALALRLDYTLLVPVGDLWGGSVWLGGRYRWDHALQYYVDWDEEHLYWLNAHELGPALAWNAPLARSHGLEVSLSIPVVALAGRPPTARTNKIDDLKSPGFLFGRPHEEMGLTSVHEYVSLEGRLTWRWSFSESWLLATSWELRYRRHASPRIVELLENSLVTALAHDF